MSDEEWERWRSAWQAEQRPMPEVLGRARTDRMRAIVGTVIFCALVTGQIVGAVLGLGHAATPLALASAVLVLATTIGLTIGFFAAMRGTWGRGGGGPEELLAALERRHAGRRRLMLVTLVGTACIVSGTLVVGVLELARRFDAGHAAALAATCGLTVGFVALVFRRVGRTIERELAQAKEARRLLEDSGDGLAVGGPTRRSEPSPRGKEIA